MGVLKSEASLFFLFADGGRWCMGISGRGDAYLEVVSQCLRKSAQNGVPNTMVSAK